MTSNEFGSLGDEIRAERLPSPLVARAIRESAGVTQIRVAQALNVHRVTVARWESGERQPRRAARAAYMQILHEMQEASS